LPQVDGADGAYDRNSVYADVHERHPEAAVIVPPRRDAVPSATATPASIIAKLDQVNASVH
jgi:hypothetical protein